MRNGNGALILIAIAGIRIGTTHQLTFSIWGIHGAVHFLLNRLDTEKKRGAVPLSRARWVSPSPAAPSGWEEGRSAYLLLLNRKSPTVKHNVQRHSVGPHFWSHNSRAGSVRLIHFALNKQAGIFMLLWLSGQCASHHGLEVKARQLIWNSEQPHRCTCRGLLYGRIYGDVCALTWVRLKLWRHGREEGAERLHTWHCDCGDGWSDASISRTREKGVSISTSLFTHVRLGALFATLTLRSASKKDESWHSCLFLKGRIIRKAWILPKQTAPE